ncbi:NADH-quinone oxidoreductase subunit NuoE [Thiorhodospira sibirica]|uniref:NADH-quinone oxidoreductase subunit NuoE family protein n=1 Tax=Thiorhodospira sibirica TaxID=154347 RepID=UPI00022C0B0E|nr:NADH-quinone oxidoreductase subunit NuoE [Thiorhodospira sibirica]
MKHLIPEFEALKQRLPLEGLNGVLLLPCLHRIQQERGYIHDEDIAFLADYLAMPAIQIIEALSFYTMLRRAPIGRWHLQLCHNLPCALCGSDNLFDYLHERLGIRPGETTPDGRFTLSAVECLGCCGTAPVMMINETYHEQLTLESLEALLKELN